jgi:hypothetical protein
MQEGAKARPCTVAKLTERGRGLQMTRYQTILGSLLRRSAHSDHCTCLALIELHGAGVVALGSDGLIEQG